jgi:hypothetical protein
MGIYSIVCSNVTPLCPDFSVEMAGNPMTAHDMPGFAGPFLEKSGNKWTSRDLTGPPILFGKI